MGFSIPNRFVNNQSLRIAVIGAGGTGSHVISKLAIFKRLLDAINNEEQPLCNIEQVDVFDDKNINQFALARGLFTTGEIGCNKAIALANRYNILLNKPFFKPYNAKFNAYQISNYDLIITAVDQAKIRVEIGNVNSYNNALWLDCGVSKNEFSVILGELGKKPNRLPNALDLTELDNVNDMENKEPSCSVLTSIERQVPFVNDINASFAISLLSQLFLQGTIEVNGCITDVNTLHSTPIEINKITFLQFGYEDFGSTATFANH